MFSSTITQSEQLIVPNTVMEPIYSGHRDLTSLDLLDIKELLYDSFLLMSLFIGAKPFIGQVPLLYR